MRLTRSLCSNYFKRYIDRTLSKEGRKPRWNPIAGWIMPKPQKWVYNEHRPWTDGFKQFNNAGPGKRKKPIPVLPLKEWSIFKGDVVEILVGKDAGKRGLVNCVIKERNWVFVEGLNCEYKTEVRYPNSPPMCTKDERPLMVTTQVKLVDPSDNKGTDIDWRYTEQGERVRVSKKTGLIIPLPSDAKAEDDLVNPDAYVECSKDTKEKELTKVTFEPKLKTFAEDIMDSMGIKEDRKPAKTYWY